MQIKMTMWYLIPVGMVIRKKRVEKDVEKLESLYTVGGNAKLCSCYEKQNGVFSKNWNSWIDALISLFFLSYVLFAFCHCCSDLQLGLLVMMQWGYQVSKLQHFMGRQPSPMCFPFGHWMLQPWCDASVFNMMLSEILLLFSFHLQRHPHSPDLWQTTQQWVILTIVSPCLVSLGHQVILSKCSTHFPYLQLLMS